MFIGKQMSLRSVLNRLCFEKLTYLLFKVFNILKIWIQMNDIASEMHLLLKEIF